MSETSSAAGSEELPKAEYHVLISDIPEGERPRERFLAVGASAMSQRELLAILIRMGPRGVGALALADQMLKEFDGLSGLARADVNELQNVHGIGPVKAIEIKAARCGLRWCAQDPAGEKADSYSGQKGYSRSSADLWYI